MTRDAAGTGRVRKPAGSPVGRALLALTLLGAALLALPAMGPARASAQPAPDGADSVTVRAIPARDVVRPGDRFPVAVVLEHARGFHSWPNRPVVPPEYEGVVPIPTEIRPGPLPSGVALGDVQWPPSEPVTVRYTGTPVELLSLVDTAVAYVPVEVAPDREPGPLRIGLQVRLQSCDERICYPPKTEELTVAFRVAAADQVPTPAMNEPELFTAYGMGPRGDRARGRALPARLEVFGRGISFTPDGPAGLALLLLLAGVGGLLLNVTPCVLPLVPIKVMGLRRAAGDPSRLLLLGASMSAGVVAFWLLLGGAVAFVSGFDAISSLFQTGWFSPLVGGVVGLAGLGMLGLWKVRLPQAVHRADPDRETLGGSFGFGVLAAVLSTPCTAPFMAGAAAWATLQDPTVTLATFAAIGAGMGTPYVLLSARPAWIERIPRTGPWSVLVKQVMGLLMLAVAAYFLGSGLAPALEETGWLTRRSYWWVVGGLVAVAFLWLGYRSWRISESGTIRAGTAGAVALVLAVLGTTVPGLAGPGPIDWVPYSPERLADHREAGRVVVMDFTAEWCLNCRALETGVLHREAVVELLDSPEVVPMRVDLTTENPAGRAMLRELDWVGIPLLAIFGPARGYDDPVKYDSYTVDMVLESVRDARSKDREAVEGR